jgi:hypothetical protein
MYVVVTIKSNLPPELFAMFSCRSVRYPQSSSVACSKLDVRTVHIKTSLTHYETLSGRWVYSKTGIERRKTSNRIGCRINRGLAIENLERGGPC